MGLTTACICAHPRISQETFSAPALPQGIEMLQVISLEQRKALCSALTKETFKDGEVSDWVNISDVSSHMGAIVLAPAEDYAGSLASVKQLHR